MPAHGIQYLPKKEILSFEEMERLVRILAALGISKVRLTGGEPFVRQDLMQLIRSISRTRGIDRVHITTNGVLTAPYVAELKALGIASVNLSLDTLDRKRFHEITLRDEFQAAYKTFQLLLDSEIPVKINTVVMDGKNTQDILPMAALARDHNISVRFIEEMPFNGNGSHYPILRWTSKEILSCLREAFPTLEKIADEAGETASHYKVPGHKGTIGIIAAFSRTFCGTCNRIRVTAQGNLKTCLYDQGDLDLKAFLRNGKDDELIKTKIIQALQRRAIDGHEAERISRGTSSIHESMSTIGG